MNGRRCVNLYVTSVWILILSQYSSSFLFEGTEEEEKEEVFVLLSLFSSSCRMTNAWFDVEAFESLLNLSLEAVLLLVFCYAFLIRVTIFASEFQERLQVLIGIGNCSHCFCLSFLCVVSVQAQISFGSLFGVLCFILLAVLGCAISFLLPLFHVPFEYNIHLSLTLQTIQAITASCVCVILSRFSFHWSNNRFNSINFRWKLQQSLFDHAPHSHHLLHLIRLPCLVEHHPSHRKQLNHWISTAILMMSKAFLSQLLLLICRLRIHSLLLLPNINSIKTGSLKLLVIDLIVIIVIILFLIMKHNLLWSRTACQLMKMMINFLRVLSLCSRSFRWPRQFSFWLLTGSLHLFLDCIMERATGRSSSWSVDFFIWLSSMSPFFEFPRRQLLKFSDLFSVFFSSFLVFCFSSGCCRDCPCCRFYLSETWFAPHSFRRRTIPLLHYHIGRLLYCDRLVSWSLWHFFCVGFFCLRFLLCPFLFCCVSPICLFSMLNLFCLADHEAGGENCDLFSCFSCWRFAHVYSYDVDFLFVPDCFLDELPVRFFIAIVSTLWIGCWICSSIACLGLRFWVY